MSALYVIYFSEVDYLFLIYDFCIEFQVGFDFLLSYFYYVFIYLSSGNFTALSFWSIIIFRMKSYFTVSFSYFFNYTNINLNFWDFIIVFSLNFLFFVIIFYYCLVIVACLLFVIFNYYKINIEHIIYYLFLFLQKLLLNILMVLF